MMDVTKDPDYEEFIQLQRDSEVKQIWADDAPIEPQPAAGIPNKAADGVVKKRHKRSRGKKKAVKPKPKEIFIHTLKIKGFPEKVRRKDIIDFFKPLKLKSIRINARDGVCYVAFQDESDRQFAEKRKNGQIWGENMITILPNNAKRSRVFKENVREKKEANIKKWDASLANAPPIEDSGRILVRNLNYNCTEGDLEEQFRKYGELTEVHLVKERALAFVEFLFPKDAAKAYEELNGSMFQDRRFHIIPAQPKRVSARNNDESFAHGQPNSTSSYKQDKSVKQKETSAKGSNWNILFLGQNAVADAVADMRQIDKSNLLTKQTNKEPIAVRIALGDARLVEQTRNFLISNGIELDSFDNPQAPRSRTVIIAKNLPACFENSELTDLFETFGRVARVLVPPSGLTAIVEMEDAAGAKRAFEKLYETKFKNSILYLEWAPINVFREKSLEDQETADLEQLKLLQTGTKILVKNVAFEATPSELRKVFEKFGELKFVRLPKKNETSNNHRGFGFVDFLTEEDALRAFRELCHSTHFYGRKLVLEWAKKE